MHDDRPLDGVPGMDWHRFYEWLKSDDSRRNGNRYFYQVWQLAAKYGYTMHPVQENSQWWMHVYDGDRWTPEHDKYPEGYGAYKCYPPGDWRNCIIAGQVLRSMIEHNDTVALFRRGNKTMGDELDFLFDWAEAEIGPADSPLYDIVGLGYDAELVWKDHQFSLRSGGRWDKDEQRYLYTEFLIGTQADLKSFVGTVGTCMLCQVMMDWRDLIIYPIAEAGQHIIGITPKDNLYLPVPPESVLHDEDKQISLTHPDCYMQLYLVAELGLVGYDSFHDYHVEHWNEVEVPDCAPGYYTHNKTGSEMWYYRINGGTCRTYRTDDEDVYLVEDWLKCSAGEQDCHHGEPGVCEGCPCA